MKSFFNVLKSARKVEILVLVAAVSTLLVLYMGNSAQPDGMRNDERRLKQIISQIEGVGDVSVMISGNEDENMYSGVVVVADSDKTMLTTLRIQRTVQILTGLDLDHIEIVNAG